MDPGSRPWLLRPRYGPRPDKPEIIELPPLELDDEFRDNEFLSDDFRSFEPPDGDIDEKNGLMLRRQQLFRWSAQAIAVAMSELPEVEKVAAFGAASKPLKMEVPRFREFQRRRIEILHECGDLDLAVWLNDVSQFHSLKKAKSRALALTHDTGYGGVAHHQVDVHVFDSASGEYRGRLCIFGQCPKAGKRECRVPGCGVQPFLQQIDGYRFRPSALYGGTQGDSFRSFSRFPCSNAEDRCEATGIEVDSERVRRQRPHRRGSAVLTRVQGNVEN